MQRPAAKLRSFACCAVLGAIASLAGCGAKEPPADAPAQPAAPPATAQQQGPPPDVTPVTAAEVSKTWTPEALEELLAPVALYPDPVLSQVLIAATNPQEVLDAGNWLLQNASLEGKPLDDAAAQVGFTPPIRALVQFPETVDMMCMELGWTTEVGEAFVADQAGVLDAVQRLRVQAIDAGNLQSSPQMTVETTEQEGKDVVLLKPAKPEVVYVPQYDPVTAYAPASTTTAAAPATTTTTAEDKGHSTGSLIATGVLAFGAGILVNELFDDDDDWDHHDYYYPNYGYGGMPYYPPYPYRPVYGGGYYPSNGYNRPPNYNSGWQNNGNIIINTGDRPNGGYWDRYDNRPGARPQPRTVNSPITASRPNRPELQQLNTRQARPMPADVKRPSADATASNWKGQSSYAGASQKSRDKMSSQERIANAKPGYSKPATGKAATRDVPGPAPKVQGTYAGAKYDRPKPADVSRPDKGTRDVQRPAPSTRDVQKPAKGQGDRGYAKPDARPAQRPQQADRPAPRPESKPSPRPSSRPAPSGRPDRTAVSGGRTGQSERAASQRGKQSMPQGARSKGGGGGGGKKKQR
jgi:predicted small lipoprotein YifL